MHIAARRGHSDMIRMLMAAGADLTGIKQLGQEGEQHGQVLELLILWLFRSWYFWGNVLA